MGVRTFYVYILCVYVCMCVKVMECIVSQTHILNFIIYFNTSSDSDDDYYSVPGTGVRFNLHSNPRRYCCHSFYMSQDRHLKGISTA